MSKPTPIEIWKQRLKEAAQKKAFELKEDKTVSIGFRCFAQLIKVPSGGPVGNPQWAYLTALREIISSDHQLSKFVIQ